MRLSDIAENILKKLVSLGMRLGIRVAANSRVSPPSSKNDRSESISHVAMNRVKPRLDGGATFESLYHRGVPPGGSLVAPIRKNEGCESFGLQADGGRQSSSAEVCRSERL